MPDTDSLSHTRPEDRTRVPHPGETKWRPAELLNSFPDWEAAVRRALEEDAPSGDVTSALLAPRKKCVNWVFRSRESGVLAGKEVVGKVYELMSDDIQLAWRVNDGDRFNPGDSLVEISGPAPSILSGERVALNYLQRMSGIATRTRNHVDAIADTQAAVLDTRKTTPGMRAFEKYAVCCGGGRTHRKTLSDVIMIKDNHLAALDQDWVKIGSIIDRLRRDSGESIHVEIEVDGIEQVDEAVGAGADSLLLDGFAIEDLKRTVASVGGKLPLEASGGVTLASIRGIAETGVDFISVGALTNGYPSIDIGLDAGPESPA